jgi:gluconolactonase
MNYGGSGPMTSELSNTALKSTLIALTCSAAFAIQAQIVEAPLHVERLDARMDGIVPRGAKLERVATGFNWVEGPVWTDGGFLLFADIPTNTIRKLEADGRVSIWMQPSGWASDIPFAGHQPGSNGMTFDLHGRLVVAGNATRSVFRLDTLDAKTTKTVLADSFEGKRLNSPNDVVFRSNGDLYFTDPPYGLALANDSDPAKETSANGVYLVRHADERGAGSAPDHDAIKLLVEDLTRPNGIASSPDENYLYVNNSEGKKAWYRFRVAPDGTLTDRMLFADASDDKRPGSPDGMKVDSDGNLYSAGPGGVWVFSSDGRHLGTIAVPERCGNVAWGGTGLHTLYITASKSVYRIALKKHGVPFKRP